MVDWRAVAYGLAAFPLAVAVALAHADPWILVTGFPSGFVAGARKRGVLAGLLYGCATGVCIAVLFLSAVFSLLVGSASTGVYPGVGFAIVGLIGIAGLLFAESALAGAVGGGL